MVEHAMSDEALLWGMRRREVAALAGLYDRHAPLAYGLAGRLFGDEEQAEAAVLAAFLTIWHQTGDGPLRPRSVRAWLFGLVARRALAARPAG